MQRRTLSAEISVRWCEPEAKASEQIFILLKFLPFSEKFNTDTGANKTHKYIELNKDNYYELFVFYKN